MNTSPNAPDYTRLCFDVTKRRGCDFGSHASRLTRVSDLVVTDNPVLSMEAIGNVQTFFPDRLGQPGRLSHRRSADARGTSPYVLKGARRMLEAGSALMHELNLVGLKLSQILICGALCIRAESAAAQAFDFDWDVPEDCPNASFVEREVTRVVGRPWQELGAHWRRARASVSAEAGGFRLRMSVLAQGGAASERNILAVSCTEATEVAVAILTTGVAPGGSSADAGTDTTSAEGPSSAGEEGREGTPPGTGENPTSAPASVEASLQVRPLLGARLGLDVGTLGAVAPFAELEAGLDPLLLEPRLPSALATSGALDKVLIALAVGGVAGFAAGFFVAHSVAASPSQAVASSASVDAPVSGNGNDTAELARPGVAMPPEASHRARPSPLKLADEPPRAAPARVTPRDAPRAAATPPVAGQLKAELDGLRRAQELLHRGDAVWAIARLDELDRANVSSLLLEERMATRAIAECRLGNDGRAQTDELVRQFPNSAHVEQVRASCEQAHQSGAPAKNSVPTQTETGGSPHK